MPKRWRPDWWSRIRPRQICLDETDFRGLQELSGSGFTFRECLTLLESSRNQEVLQQIRSRLDQGETLSDFLALYCPQKYRPYVVSFLRFMPLSESLQLACEIVAGEERIRQDLTRELLYPSLLFVSALMGIQLFARYCFPPMIEIMSGFHLDLGLLVRFQQTAVALSLILILILFAFLALVFWLQKPQRRIRSYYFLCRQMPDSLLVQYETLQFIRFFQLCTARGNSTRQSLQILQTLKFRPVLASMSAQIEEHLLAGQTLTQAFDQIWLDPVLERFLKIMVHSSSPLQLLNGYLETAQQSLLRKTKRDARLLQLLAYALIGLVIILVYQILLLPLSMMAQL